MVISETYYVCDICGKKVDGDSIPGYHMEFTKATLTLGMRDDLSKLPYSKMIDVCKDCVNRIFKEDYELLFKEDYEL